MKKRTKQFLALLLAVCTLAGFAMPTVFATQEAEGSAPAPVPESVTYQFYNADWGTSSDATVRALRAHTAEIKAAYDEGTSNWRYEAMNNAYQFGRGGNSFASGTASMEFTTSATQWVAVRIKSPGAGRYDLTYAHGAKNQGAVKGGMYILDAGIIDGILGENAADYAESVSADPYQENGATDAFSAFVTAINATLEGKESVITSNYYAASTTKNVLDTGSFIFEADKEYVIVFKSEEKAEGASTARLLLTSLTATFSADQSGVNPPEPVTYQFYNADWKETPVRNHTAEIKAAYDEGTSNWRYEAMNNAYQFGRNGNSFASGTASMEFTTSATHWVAVRIKSPGAGKFDLTYAHGAKNQGALKGGMYILDAGIIDGILGENAAEYAESVSADPYQENGTTDAFSAFVTAINATLEGKESVITSNYYAASTTKNVLDTGSFTFEADKEYVIVFKSEEKAEGASTARLLLTSLTATYAEEQDEEEEEGGETPAPVPVDPTTYQFYNAQWKNTAFRDHTAEIKAAYDADTSNWRYEAISNIYQMRPGAGQNTFASGTQSVEIVCGQGVWFAVRIKSPGTGMFDLTLTHGAKKAGATKGGVYIIKADVVDEALGEDAAAYAEAMSADPYQENGTTDAFLTYFNVLNALVEGETSVMTPNYNADSATPGLTATGRFGFVADEEYVIVFRSEGAREGESTARLLLNSLTATFSDDQTNDGGEGGEGGEGNEPGGETPEQPETPAYPAGPGYTEGTYDFYQGVKAGSRLEDGIDAINTWYEKGELNWKYETHFGLKLSMVKYIASINSMYAESAETWWLAMRIKAPAQDGAYDIKMVHGAKGDGTVAGSIFVIPGDTATEDITKVMTRTGEVMSADWSYGTLKADVIGGRETTTGSVNLKAGEEYIVIFMSTARGVATDSKNGSFLLGQLQVTRTGDIVEGGGSEGEDGSVLYEFYDWDNPGNFLIHYKTEEELGKLIVTDKIAQEYADGTRNWKYEPSNGFASFSTGTPYLNAIVGETLCLALRIKAPGTGTYSIEYTHYASTASTAADYGYVYVVAVPNKEYDSSYIFDEIAFKDPIITTSYKAEKNGLVTVTGEYTAFEEGKEYLICFGVGDTNSEKKSSIGAYPQSMKMVRTGDYKPEPNSDYDDGTVYNLILGDEYKNKYLWHSGDQSVYNEVTKRFENGTLNWRLEAMGGSATYSNQYVKSGVSKEGGVMGFRIKAPGTGKYKLILKYFLGNDVRDANSGELYFVEAPAEYVDGAYLADKMGRAPIATGKFSHNGNGLKKASIDGTVNMEAGKEYLIILYLSDIDERANTTKSTWAYLSRFVFKRIGEFEPEPEHFNKGGVVVKDANRLFRTAGSVVITEINGHDYLAMAVYGGTMMLYDLDEWRLIDEVLTGVPTPRGITMDHEGKLWITGDTKMVYSYDPYTLTGEMHNLGLPGGSAYNITCGDDGYLYWSTYASTGAYIHRMNPQNIEERTMFTYSGWSCYMADMEQKGDYIYVGTSGEERHEMWKINKYTGKVVDSVDITAEMMETRYIDGVEFLDENYLWFAASSGITVIDVRTMEKLPAEKIGIDGVITRAISGELNGKRYFISSKAGLGYYDIATQTFGLVSGDVVNARTALRGKDHNFATIDDERLPGKSIITYGGMSADGVNLTAYNPENGAYVTLIGLVETSFAYGQDLREMGVGLPGSGEIYYGANYEAPVQVYNCLTNEEGRAFATNGQADAFHWYKDQLYIGNYNQAVLTRMENGQPIALFRLNGDSFYQARIHTISGGDDKVFVGTVPHVYQNGGVLAWYDLNTELTYVVTGPNPEDVYYAKASKVTVTEQWYSAVTHELVDIEKEWDKDEDGDGVCKYFKGPIPLQSITKVVYRNGLIFGLAAPMGGTSAVNPAGYTAKMFIYDVENMKMLKVFDIGDYISGLPYPLHALAAFEGDPEISNKFWGVVSETLFSMTYDFDTGKITIKEELSFDKTTIKNGNGWFCNDMLFQGDYIYVMLYKKGGLCRINRNNPKEYEQLLYNFDSVKDMPSSFVLADDGDLYYMAGTTLYVLNLDITEEERATAKSVQDAIDLIPAEVALTDRSVIEAARAAWDAMAPANQPLVKNYQKLEEAEIELLRLRIADLGEITIEDEAELVAIRKTYSTLTLEQRMSIDFLTVSKAESIMSILRGERMVNQIAAIGEVTLEKEQLIRDARAAFMALSRYERTLVTNIEVLNTAEAVLTGLILRRNEAETVEKLIDEIGFVFFSGEKISVAREAYDKLDAETQAWVENYKTLTKAETLLIVEYVIAVLLVVGGAVIVIVNLRKKKVKAE